MAGEQNGYNAAGETMTVNQLMAYLGNQLRSAYNRDLDAQLPAELEKLVRQLQDGTRRAKAPEGSALIVEDDAEICELAAVFLEEFGYSVLTSPDAECALDLMKEHGGDVHLIFVDIRLPGEMDGVDLAQAVSTLWPTTKIVATSGGAGSRVQSLPQNVVFLQKPWKGLDLLLQAEAAMKPQPPIE